MNRTKKYCKHISARRFLSILLASVMVLSSVPADGLSLAVYAEETDTGLCSHHSEHTEECGYRAPTEGQPCHHEHTDECYTKETDCAHVHDETCYSDVVLPEEDKEADTCAHVCTEESGCITLVLTCQHTHDELCGYIPEDFGQPCAYECSVCTTVDEKENDADTDASDLPEDITENNKEEVRTQLDTTNVPDLSDTDTAVKELQGMIDALPHLEEVQSMDAEQQEEIYNRLQEAYDAYEALSDKEQEEIENTEIFEELFGWFNSQIMPLEEATYSGDFGNNNKFHWSLTDDGTLTITGEGEMPYFSPVNNQPWYTLSSNITKLMIGENVTSVGMNAFNGCANLTNIELPSSLTSIGSDAFRDCTSLTNIKLPERLILIDFSAFQGCVNLTNIELPDSLTTIEANAFRDCTSLALTKLPDSVTYIGGSAFHSCSSLALTTLPSGLTSIENFTFHGCSNLALTTLPNSVTSIGSYAFSLCYSLALTELPNNVTYIGGSAFSSCSSLALTKLPDNLTSIENYTFNGCTNLALTTLSNNITSIGDRAFNGCANLALTEIPSSVTSIGEGAFRFCIGLTKLTFTKDIAPTLGKNAFLDSNDFTIIIPEGAKGYIAANNWPENKIYHIATPILQGETSKTYDGTTAAPKGLSIILKDVTDTNMTVTATFAYDNANAGENKTITASNITLSGDNAKKYKLTTDTLTIQGSITLATQNALPAPTAAEENITDTRITLDSIANAEYSMDGANWQDSPVFSGLSPNRPYTFYVRLKANSNYYASPSSVPSTFTTKKSMLDGATVTISGSYTYDGTPQVPTKAEVSVVLDGVTIDPSQYTISAINNNINAGKASLTITGEDNCGGSVTKDFTILPADLSSAILTLDADFAYICTGNPLTPDVSVTLDSKALTKDIDYIVSYSDNINAGDATAKVIVTGKGNYTGTVSSQFSIRYYDVVVSAKFNGEDLIDGYYKGIVIMTADGFTISDTIDGDYQNQYLIEEDTEGTFFFKQNGTGYITEGSYYKIKVDNLPPSGRIALNYRWWENVLHFISFGHYQMTDKTISITAHDTQSGLDSIQYAIVTGDTQYTTIEEVEAANLTWTTYNASIKPTVATDTKTVIYAKLTDNMGNTAYISSDGILLDKTAPTISSLTVLPNTITDSTLQISLTLDEAANVYFVAVPKTDAAKTYPAADVIMTCDSTAIGADGGNIIRQAAFSDALTVDETQANTVLQQTVTGLIPNREYHLYIVAVDKVIDMDHTIYEFDPVYTGNISEVQSLSFTTTKAPLEGKVSLVGTAIYGQELTAEVSEVRIDLQDAGTLTYKWYRTDANEIETLISEAKAQTYTVTAEDIGCTLTVKVSAENCIGELQETTDVVKKANCPKENYPTNGQVHDAYGIDSFTFNGKSGVAYEYSTDGGNTWADVDSSMLDIDSNDSSKVTGTITVGNIDLASGKMQVRAKETDIYQSGDVLSNDVAFTAVVRSTSGGGRHSSSSSSSSNAPTAVTEQNISNMESPETGDNSPLWLWILLLLAGSTGIAVTTEMAKRKRRLY